MAGLLQQGIKPLISARRWKGGVIQGELCNWTLWKRWGGKAGDERQEYFCERTASEGGGSEKET